MLGILNTAYLSILGPLVTLPDTSETHCFSHMEGKDEREPLCDIFSGRGNSLESWCQKHKHLQVT